MMETLTSKINAYGVPSKTPKGAVPKAGITFEQLSAYNKENLLDSGRRDKSNSRIEESSSYQTRTRSLEKKNGNQNQNSYTYNRNDNSTTSNSGLANLSNFFNSPKGAEGEFFKNQDKNSYTAKHVNKGLKTSFRQDEKTHHSGLNDQYLQSKIDQIINSSLSLKERSKNNASISKGNSNANSVLDEKPNEKATLYTRLLNDMRTSTPKSKNIANQEQQNGVTSKHNGPNPTNEFYTRNSEAKKPYLDLKISGAEPDNNTKIAKEEAKALKSFQRMSFSQKKEKDENTRPERAEQQQDHSRRGESIPKQERLSASKALTVNTQHASSEPQFGKHPQTTKTTTAKGGLRYNDNQALYESLTNLKKTLERTSNSLARSTTLNGPVYNNFVANETREAKPIFKSVTPKADTVTSSEVKNVLQSFKMFQQRENQTQGNEDKSNNAANRKTLDDETYQTYLKVRGIRNKEKTKNTG